jgi:hypothetical protein
MNIIDSCYRRDRKLWCTLFTCLAVYLFTAKGYLEESDTFFSLQTAEAILDHGQTDIPYLESATVKAPDGRSYSKWGLGLPLYYVPLVGIGRVLSTLTKLPAQQVIGFLISFANLPFAALALIFFYKLLRLLGIREIYAAFLLLGLGIGTLAWRYSVYDFSEAMQMGLLMLTLYSVVRRSIPAVCAGGVAFAWLVLVKLIYVVFFPAFAIYLFTRPGALRSRLKVLALFSLPLIVVCCFVGWLNAIRFGSAFESGYGNETSQFFPSQLLRTTPLLMGSLDKGLFIFCPILILGLFGWKEYFRQHKPECILCVVLITENLAWAASWHSWEGGWSWGPRYVVPIIPLWLLPSAFLLQGTRSRQLRAVFVLVMLVSIITQIPGVLVKDQEIHLIKCCMLTPTEQAAAPSDYVAAYVLLRHKLVLHDEVYQLSELHIPGTRQLDLTRYRTFRGLNLWTELSSRQFNKPALRWFPVLGLFALIYLIFQLRRAIDRDLAKKDSSPSRCGAIDTAL